MTKRILVALSRGAALASLFATTLASRDAHAAGYLTASYGSDYGTPAMANGYAVYFNPAALGGTTGTTITGDVTAVFRWASYQRTTDALSPSDKSSLNDPNYVQANTGKANLFDVVPLPYVGVNTDFGTKNLRAGYAFYIPYGGAAQWAKRNQVAGVPGTVDGPQRWQNISGQILAIYNTVAIAYRFPDIHLSIGANVSPVIHQVKTIEARNTDGSDDTVNGTSLSEGRTYLDVHGLNIDASLGVYWEPSEKLRLGLSYTAQPGFGETKMKGTLESQLATAPTATEQVDFYQAYPDVIRLGAVVDATSKLQVRADVDYERWSVLKRQCVVKSGKTCDVSDDGKDNSGGSVILNIPRHWNDAIGARVGPAFAVNDRFTVHGSLGLSTPAAPKTTIDASTIDAFRLAATVGVRYAFSDHFALAGSYTHLHYFTVDTKGANDLDLASHGGDTDYNVSRSPSADGVYKSEVGLLNVNAAYRF